MAKTNKTIDERLADIEAKENRLKQQKKKLKAEQSKQARNARAKRLIEIGAIVEKALGIELDTVEKREKFSTILMQGKIGTTYTYGSYFREQVEKKNDEQ